MIVLSKSLSRIAAFAILCGIIFLLDIIAINPAISFWLDHNEHVENQIAKLSRFNKLLASREILESQHKEIQTRLDEQGILRKGATPAIAAAEIQSQIRRIIGNLGGTVLSTVDLPIDDKAFLKRVGVHVVLEGGFSVVVGILSSSEIDKPIVFINNLSIHAPDLTQTEKTLTKLTIGFDAYGYVLDGAP
jgi:general secretion pathway protein M